MKRCLPPPYFPQSLKDELDDVKRKEASDEKVMATIAAENKRMSEPMRRAIADVARLREERDAYKRDLVALAEAKASALVVQDRLEALRWEHEILAQRTSRLEDDKAALTAKFSAAVHDIQQKAGFKQLLLEQKLAAATEEGERAQMALGEVLANANIEGGAAPVPGAKRMAQGVAEVRGGGCGGGCCAAGHQGLHTWLTHAPLSSSHQRDAQVAELQVVVARIASAFDAMVGAFRAKLEEKHIPVSNLGFPLQTAAQLLGVKPV